MKILVIDDHPTVRRGIQQLFARDAGVVVLEAEDAASALAAARSENPDVYVLDVKLEGASGLEVLRKIRAHDRAAKVLVYTAFGEASIASRALRSGASGFVTKAASLEELRQGIALVAKGERYLDSVMSAKVSVYCTTTEDGLNKLTDRELEVLRLLGEGRSLQQVADEIGAAYKTVANVSSRIKDKLDLRRTSDLIRFYLQGHGDKLQN